MPLSPLLLLGFILLNLGFWPFFIALGRRRGLGSSRASVGRAGDAIRNPKPGFEKLALRAGPLLFIAGAMCCFLGVAANDRSINQRCRKACETQGFEKGITRGSPHVERPQDTARECWCYNGRGKSQTWAKEGIALPKQSP